MREKKMPRFLQKVFQVYSTESPILENNPKWTVKSITFEILKKSFKEYLRDQRWNIMHNVLLSLLNTSAWMIRMSLNLQLYKISLHSLNLFCLEYCLHEWRPVNKSPQAGVHEGMFYWETETQRLRSCGKIEFSGIEEYM